MSPASVLALYKKLLSAFNSTVARSCMVGELLPQAAGLWGRCHGWHLSGLVGAPAAQLRGQEELRRRLLLRGGYGDDGRLLAGVAPADALLLVSGSHPARRLLRWSGLLHNSVDALSIAGALRQQGLLRASLWAVANPLLDSPENLQRKARLPSKFPWNSFRPRRSYLMLAQCLVSMVLCCVKVRACCRWLQELRSS